ncbi:hypothetical protein WJX73_008968 [Symbiochloris irregularis]|uniref:DUF2237 domain-containing protein n=1 Tax=Symbiochloris irregularis TaxID=706552 RepID=A0AAW1PX93_9CHLO
MRRQLLLTPAVVLLMLNRLGTKVSALPVQRVSNSVQLNKPTRISAAQASGSAAQMTNNVLGGDLEPCANGCGFSRDGYCRVTDGDFGVHAVAAVVTDDFLTYTKSQGNDLSTPMPPSFPGLKAGDRWCLCAGRWLQAEKAGKAPKVVLAATDAKALDTIPLELLKKYAA